MSSQGAPIDNGQGVIGSLAQAAMGASPNVSGDSFDTFFIMLRNIKAENDHLKEEKRKLVSTNWDFESTISKQLDQIKQLELTNSDLSRQLLDHAGCANCGDSHRRQSSVREKGLIEEMTSLTKLMGDKLSAMKSLMGMSTVGKALS